MGSNKKFLGNPTIFLDRDGVITSEILRKDGTFGSPRETFEIEYIGQSLDTLKNFSNLNFNTVVISNQPDINNKRINPATLYEINNVLFNSGRLSAILYCPHDRTENCFCRKPEQEMLTWAAQYFDVKPNQCVMVGDRKTDIEAADNFGCEAIHISNQISSCNSLSHEHFQNLEKASNYIFTKFKS